jgi:uncharacterized DUF497 family protein
VKAERNLRVRGISFETAKEVFSDPNQVTVDNYFIHDHGEQRYGIIGTTLGLILLMVVSVDRSEDDVETLHIISARKAEKYELQTYTAHLKNQDHGRKPEGLRRTGSKPG